jgi:hypothetical protein
MKLSRWHRWRGECERDQMQQRNWTLSNWTLKGQRCEKKLVAAVRNKRMIASSGAPNFSLQLLLRARI